MLITPFLFTWVNEELFEFNKMLFAYVLTVLIVGSWLLRMIVSQRPIFKRTKLDGPLLAFVITQALATVFSLHSRTSVFGYYTRFHGGLLSTITYALLYWTVVSNFNFKQIKQILLSALLAAVGISLYAIPEHFGGSPSCLMIRGNFDVNCWVQDVRGRVFATFGQPNWLAAYLITLLPVGISLYISNKYNQKKQSIGGWLLLMIALAFTALLFTNSRSGLLGLSMGLTFYFSWLLIKKVRNKHASKIKKDGFYYLSKVIAIMIAITLVIGTDFTPNLEQLWSRLKGTTLLQKAESDITTQPQTTNKTTDRTNSNPNINITPSEEIRFIVWHGAINIWRQYPILGSGPGTFAYSYYQHRPKEHNLVSEWDFLYNKAHNEWLNYLSESGLVGLLTYLWLIGTSLYLGWQYIQNSSNNKDKQNWVLGLMAGMLALHVSNFLGFSTVMVTILWTIMTANIAVANDGYFLEKKQKKMTANLIQILTAIMLIIIQLHLLLKVASIWQADYYFTKAKSLTATQEYQDAITYFQQAIALSPHEALYYDELASLYADVASQLQTIQEQAAAQQYTQLAIAASDEALAINPRHLNFYQSRAAIYSKLAVVNEDYLRNAHDTLQTAQLLAPTHPKLVYQEGLVFHSLGNNKTAIKLIKQAIDMKPNYHQARYKLGQIYEQQKQYQLALDQYQYILDYLIPNDPYLPDKIEELNQEINQQVEQE